MTRNRKDILVRFIRQVWDEGRADDADAFLSDRYTLHHDPGDPWNGLTLDRPGFRDRVRSLRAGFPDQRFVICHLLADGDAVAMFWLWSGTHLADIPGFRATGTVIHLSGATLYGFDDADRLTGHWQITDRLGVYQQLQLNQRP